MVKVWQDKVGFGIAGVDGCGKAGEMRLGMAE
jgi:hypothetical protein